MIPVNRLKANEHCSALQTGQPDKEGKIGI